MNRNLALVGGALIFVAAVAVGGLTLIDSPNSAPTESAPNETPREMPDDTPTGEGPFGTPTDDTPAATSTPAPPVFHPDDPSRQTFPRDANTADEEIVASDILTDHLRELINSYREEHNDLSTLVQTGTLTSVSRTHSWDMHERGFVSTTNPEGETPVDRYEGYQTECEAVTEYVFDETRVVETADGDRQDVSSKDIAEDVFYQMRTNRTMHDSIINDSYNGIGVGTYVVGGENDEGAIEVTAYVTVDYCAF